MVTLYIPFRNEEIDILDCNKFIEIYDENETLMMEARKDFEASLNIVKTYEHRWIKNLKYVQQEELRKSKNQTQSLSSCSPFQLL